MKDTYVITLPHCNPCHGYVSDIHISCGSADVRCGTRMNNSARSGRYKISCLENILQEGG